MLLYSTISNKTCLESGPGRVACNGNPPDPICIDITMAIGDHVLFCVEKKENKTRDIEKKKKESNEISIPKRFS